MALACAWAYMRGPIEGLFARFVWAEHFGLATRNWLFWLGCTNKWKIIVTVWLPQGRCTNVFWGVTLWRFTGWTRHFLSHPMSQFEQWAQTQLTVQIAHASASYTGNCQLVGPSNQVTKLWLCNVPLQLLLDIVGIWGDVSLEAHANRVNELPVIFWSGSFWMGNYLKKKMNTASS